MNRQALRILKLAVARAAHRLGLIRGLLHMQRKRPLILRYHRVYPNGVTPFYELGMPLSVFEAQLDFLKRHFRVLPLPDVCAALKNPGRALPDRAVAITFDDGYGDNFTQAFPALRARRLPATIFICPDNVERGEPFWWDRLARAILDHRSDAIALDIGRGPETFFLDGMRSRRRLMDHACEALKSLSTARARQTVESLEASAGEGPVDPSVEATLLSWDQIEVMAGAGIEVGAHSLDHPILSQLHPSQAQWQIVESRRRIEQRLSRPVPLFSYPNGKAIDAGPEIRRMVREAGYEAAVSTIEGRTSRQSDPYWLERKGVPLGATTDLRGRFSGSLFATELSGLYDFLFQRRRRERALH